MLPSIEWPEGKDFAFTIIDDPDRQTLENGKPIYDLLYDLDFRTTKAVWPNAGKKQAGNNNHHNDVIGNGSTCNDQDYLAWVQQLQQQGFEVALHGTTFHSATRDEIAQGLKRFNEFFGTGPNIQINHASNKDNLYWMDARFDGIYRFIYNLMHRFKHRDYAQGHIPQSPHFWGDLCQAQIKYARGFTFNDINTLRCCHFMPYHDLSRPYVNYWFASSNAANAGAYTNLLSEKNQDKLESESGACIIFTHLGQGFYNDNQINAKFASLMKRLSKKNGWFVPATTLLDFLQAKMGQITLTPKQRNGLQRKWLIEKAFSKIRAGYK